jgi:hypothetical protein
MNIKKVRHWYAVYIDDTTIPIYFVSAFSIKDIDDWLKFFKTPYTIKMAETQLLVSIMAGKPDTMVYSHTLAPNSWYMIINNKQCRVVILN